MPSLVLLAHGSTINPDSSAPCRMAADAIEAMGCFAQVRAGFWKESPALAEVLDAVTVEPIFVVPFFMADGHFTRRVLPRELARASAGRDVRWCQPVGTHPSLVAIIAARVARALAGEAPPSEVAVALVGHGTARSRTSTASVEAHAAALRATGRFKEVVTAFTDVAPRVPELLALTTAPALVVVPVMTADGYHTRQTIPEDLGVVPGAQGQPVGGRRLWLTGAVGTDPGLVEVVLERVAQVRGAGLSMGSVAPAPLLGTMDFLDGLDGGGRGLGALWAWRQGPGAWLCHRDDRDRREALTGASLAEVEAMARVGAGGSVRPVPMVGALARGWRLGPLAWRPFERAVEALAPGALSARALVTANGQEARADGQEAQRDGAAPAVCAACSATPRWCGAPGPLAVDEHPCRVPCALAREAAAPDFSSEP